MKRLLCLLSNMNAGGAETYLMKLYRCLDKKHYQMDFCVNVFEPNYYEAEIQQLGGIFYKIPSRLSDFKEHDRQLTSIIAENSYKYVLVVSSHSTAFWDLRIAKKAGAEWCSVRSSNSDIGMNIKNRIFQIGLRVLFNKYADVLLAPSDLAAINLFGKDYLKDVRFHYLENGLDFEKYKFSEDSRLTERKNLSIGKDTLVIGHVGRFDVQKNHAFLIDIYREIVELIPNSCLVLIGTGVLENSIQQKVEKEKLTDKVFFLGVRSDVASLLSAMDVFVFPSLYEGMPNTVIEAQASGLLCFISDTITKEANVANRVEYLSLKLCAKEWAEKVAKTSLDYCRDTKGFFVKEGYDIENCMKKFVDYVFR